MVLSRLPTTKWIRSELFENSLPTHTQCSYLSWANCNTNPTTPTTLGPNSTISMNIYTLCLTASTLNVPSPSPLENQVTWPLHQRLSWDGRIDWCRDACRQNWWGECTCPSYWPHHKATQQCPLTRNWEDRCETSVAKSPPDHWSSETQQKCLQVSPLICSINTTPAFPLISRISSLHGVHASRRATTLRTDQWVSGVSHPRQTPSHYGRPWLYPGMVPQAWCSNILWPTS